MSDDSSPLPWTTRQWDDLRAVALESARKSRVASTFLPLVGPLPADQATVPSNWMSHNDDRQPGEPPLRLEVRAGKTLQLVTISCNVYLRGSEIADPDLDSAKSMVRRVGELLGRLEDAIIFHGIESDMRDFCPRNGARALVQPEIYTVSGGRDLTGLLQAPDTDFWDRSRREPLKSKVDKASDAEQKAAAPGADEQANEANLAAQEALRRDTMFVRVGDPDEANPSPIFDAIVKAVQKLETQGHFGPFAVVLGHTLFSDATRPSRSLVLPSDRLAEFLDGRRILRSGMLPAEDGVVVALGGQPIELVLAHDVDVKFLQVTTEPRYVLRVFERFVLRIKELDAVCRLLSTDEFPTPGFVPRRARG